MSRSGILAAAVGSGAAICLAAIFGPPGAAAALLLAPLPGIVVGGIVGASYTAVASVMVALVVGGSLDWHFSTYYLTTVGIPATLAVCALRAAWRIENVVALTVAALLVASGTLLLLSVNDAGSLRSAVQATWKDGFDGAVAFYRDLGVSAEQLDALEAREQEVATGLLNITPALVVLAGVIIWFVNLRLSSRWVPWPQLLDLKRWKTPFWLIWVLISAGFAMFIPVSSVAIIARNVFAVVLACYFFQGLAIVSYFFQRFRLPRGVRVATYLLIGLQQIVAGVVLVLGVFDFWGDFRRLEVRPADARAGGDS